MSASSKPLFEPSKGNFYSIFQPSKKTARTDLEELLHSIPIEDILGWNVQEAASLLDLLQMPQYKKNFLENEINGKVLLSLSEAHLMGLNIVVVGDRLILEGALRVLRRRRIDYEQNRTLWEGFTPPSCEYSSSCVQCCCFCCYYKTFYKVTPQGIRRRPDRGGCWTCITCQCMKPRRTDFVDFRFLKDIEIEKRNCCCCCWPLTSLHIVSASQFDPEGEKDGFVGNDSEMKLYHPEAEKVESIIRNAWQCARLVQD
mmetsp:Transcript_22657/g.57744  ORF Transcript_22657/g.57744 Transcript_22657/m.57744 type:complete len:257 (-) Transcript_22657:226-996(-)